jgi:hypothetical protein
MGSEVGSMARCRRRRSTASVSGGEKIMGLDEALAYIRERGYSLVFTDAGSLQVDIWTSGRRVPLALRRAIYANRATLAAMMEEGARAVCPNPLLHKRGRVRRIWGLPMVGTESRNRNVAQKSHGQTPICKTCAELAPFIRENDARRPLRAAA